MPDDSLIKICSSKNSLRAKKPFLAEYFRRIREYDVDFGIFEVLDPLFNTQKDEMVYKSMNVLNDFIKQDTSKVDGGLGGFNKTAKLLSNNYFNKIGVQEESAKRAMIHLSYGVAEIGNDGKRYGLLISGLGSAASLDDHVEFSKIINMYNHKVRNSNIDHKELTMEDLDRFSRYIDYSRHNIYMLHEDSFPIGVAENMLYSKKVLENLDIRNR